MFSLILSMMAIKGSKTKEIYFIIYFPFRFQTKRHHAWTASISQAISSNTQLERHTETTAVTTVILESNATDVTFGWERTESFHLQTSTGTCRTRTYELQYLSCMALSLEIKFETATTEPTLTSASGI